MNSDKKLNLQKFYKEITEQQLIDMLAEDEKDFEEGVYALLVEEAKRRGLEDKLDEIKKIKKEEKQKEAQNEYKFIRVYTTWNVGETALIKSILDAQNIPYYIKGENFGTLYGPAYGLSSMDVMVREEYWEEAKALLKDFITPQQKE